MRLHDLAAGWHNLTHRHYTVPRDGTGTFKMCASRLPAPLGRVKVGFQPDFEGARWWGVPRVPYGKDDDLLRRMTRAQNAHQAMALLRKAYDELNEDTA
jgi:hypothetical protein